MEINAQINYLLEKKNFYEAERLIRDYLKNNPLDHLKWNILGVILADTGRLDEAVEAYQEAINLAPEIAIYYNNLSVAYKKMKNYDASKKCIEKALEIDPNLAEAINNLANLYRDMGELTKAKELYEKAVQLRPEMPEFALNLAIVNSELDNLKEALEILKNILMKNPYYHPARRILGSVLFKMGKIDEAESNIRLALLFNPEDVQAYIQLGGILVMSEPSYPKEAEELLLKALKLNPNFAEAYQNLGTLYSILGNREKAKECYKRAYEINPDNPLYLRLVISEENVTEDNPLFQKLKEYETKTISPRHKVEILYALSEAYEKMGKKEEFFKYLVEANRLKRKMLSYSNEIVKDTVKKRIEIFSEENVKKLSGFGYPSKIPVFVIGMPRSGTTLMESIIDSHPDAYGAGELKLSKNILKDGIWIEGIVFTGSEDETLPPKVLKAPHGFFEVGRRYVKTIRTIAPHAKRIVDKMPGNVFNLGIIALSLPWSKIIHMRRHPLDTIFSCFKQAFAEGHEYTYDLVELAEFYNYYFLLMNHWRKVFPDRFIDVDYEALVLNPEREIRRVLDYLELEYHPGCLKFYEKERPVKTASQRQVRQPIYRSSLGKWKEFEKYLTPLFEVLSDEVKEEIKRVEELISDLS